MKKEELERMKFLQDSVNMRLEKIKVHQERIDILRKLNQKDGIELERFWDIKYKIKKL